MVYYYYTVKKVSKGYPTQKHYLSWLDYAASKRFLDCEHTWEFDSHNILHIHGIADARKNFWVNTVSQQWPGYHIDIHPITDRAHFNMWLDYIKKDNQNPEHIKQYQSEYEWRQQALAII